MVNSHNSRSPIVLDTPDGASASSSAVIEITDSGGLSRGHFRRRRHDSTDDVIVADSPKRPRVDVPVIDLTSDTEDEYATADNNAVTERLLMSMREQVRNSTRTLAELRARREHAMSLLPDDARQRIRRALRHRNHPRHHFDDHHGNSRVDNAIESSRPQASVNVLDDSIPAILVDDDESNGPSNVFNHDDDDDNAFSRPSCSRVNLTRTYLPDNSAGNGRPSSLPATSRSERSRMSSHNNTYAQESNVNENGRPSSHNRDSYSSRISRGRNHRRRQNLRECLAYLSTPLARNTSNAQTNADENLARNIQSAEFQAGGPSVDETLPNFISEIDHQRLTRRLPSRNGLSLFEQPVQPYIPDLLLPAMLSFWAPESRLRHFGDSEDEREDYEALWNLTERLGQVKPKGLSKAEMDDIHAFRYSAARKDSTNGSCVVCMMDYSNKEKLRRLPCDHDFHAKCIDRWLKNNRSCPVCRKDVIST